MATQFGIIYGGVGIILLFLDVYLIGYILIETEWHDVAKAVAIAILAFGIVCLFSLTLPS